MRLPDVRPEHVQHARKLKKYLMGDLTAHVSTFPPFPWSESVFLRAQIARIAAATVLSPAGWFSEEEQEDGSTVLVAAEASEPLSRPDGELDEWLASWVHRCGMARRLPRSMRACDVTDAAPLTRCRVWVRSAHLGRCRAPHLKRQGRCETKTVREADPDAEEEEEEARELDEDEQEQPPDGGQVLAPVSRDAAAVTGAANAWTPVFGSLSKHTQSQVVGVRSTTWAGAVACAQGTACYNVYIGWAVKGGPYVPPPPPPVAAEYDQAAVASVDLPVKADPSAGAVEGGGEDGAAEEEE